jgi:hypothetical protein
MQGMDLIGVAGLVTSTKIQSTDGAFAAINGGIVLGVVAPGFYSGSRPPSLLLQPNTHPPLTFSAVACLYQQHLLHRWTLLPRRARRVGVRSSRPSVRSAKQPLRMGLNKHSTPAITAAGVLGGRHAPLTAALAETELS